MRKYSVLNRAKRHSRWWVWFALSGLVACANNPVDPAGAELNRGNPSAEAAPSVTPVATGNAPSAASNSPSASAPLLELGEPASTVVLPPARPPIRLDGDAVMLNFEEAPLSEVLHAIIGETLGLDYVIENNVPGTITLRTRSPIPRDQLLPILESLLRSNNVMMIRGPNDRFFISSSNNVRSTVPSFESAPSEGFSNVIVPLQYISAAEMAEILKPVSRDDTFVRIDHTRNLLVLSGTQLQLDGWLGIISTFDVDQLEGMSVGIFPLENSEAGPVLEELEQIIAGNAGAAGGKAAGIAAMVSVMPVERLNSIMVVSPQPSYVETVGEWVNKLDGAMVEALEPTLHVYPVKNGDAMQLAGLLSTIFGGGGSGGGSTSGGVAPGMEKATAGAGGQGRGRSNRPSGGGSFNLEGDVRVVADSYNNTLLVYSTPFEFEKISATLTKLDVVATQVLIEASIVEVTLQDDLRYGLEWAFENNLGGGDIGRGLLDFGGNLGQAAGFSYTISSGGDPKAVLNALAEKSLVNVISTPSIMVLDNHTASIHVGDQQPIQSGTTTTSGGNVQNNITYKDTGVKLEVTPTVNDGGLVTLDIDQSVTDVGNIDAATDQRSFRERQVASRVAIRTGESVVLGGLISDNETTGRSGVPLLMDIPVLGSLFSKTANETRRTELLIFITPTVLESDSDMRDLNREMRARMTGLKNFADLPVKLPESEATE